MDAYRNEIHKKILPMGIVFQVLVASSINSFTLAFCGLTFFAWLLGNPLLLNNLTSFIGIKRYVIVLCVYFHISVFTWSLLEVSMWVFEYLLNVNYIFMAAVWLLFDIACCVKLLVYFNNQYTIRGIHFIILAIVCFYFQPTVFCVLWLGLLVSLLHTEWVFDEVRSGRITTVFVPFLFTLTYYVFNLYCIYANDDMLLDVCKIVLKAFRGFSRLTRG